MYKSVDICLFEASIVAAAVPVHREVSLESVYDKFPNRILVGSPVYHSAFLSLSYFVTSRHDGVNQDLLKTYVLMTL